MDDFQTMTQQANDMILQQAIVSNQIMEMSNATCCASRYDGFRKATPNREENHSFSELQTNNINQMPSAHNYSEPPSLYIPHEESESKEVPVLDSKMGIVGCWASVVGAICSWLFWIIGITLCLTGIILCVFDAYKAGSKKWWRNKYVVCSIGCISVSIIAFIFFLV